MSICTNEKWFESSCTSQVCLQVGISMGSQLSIIVVVLMVRLVMTVRKRQLS